MEGITESKLVRTTKKSRTFQASRKYVNLSRINPWAIILIIHSHVNITMKTGSEFSTIWFRIDPFPGFS